MHKPDLTRLTVSDGDLACGELAGALAGGEFSATHDVEDWYYPVKRSRFVDLEARSADGFEDAIWSQPGSELKNARIRAVAWSDSGQSPSGFWVSMEVIRWFYLFLFCV